MKNGDLCCLMDTTTDLTREEERELFFSPFLTEGLNQKRRIQQQGGYSTLGHDGQ